ncbi:MAG: GmrSD restriction endonuclease domain-containing protein [Gammaproteobacteria bacterium]
MKHGLQDLITLRGVNTGFHVEHILSRNDESLVVFDGDEDRLEVERNRFGAVLLPKGKHNISSGNERYTDKLKSYANTLYWNETLRKDTYHSKLDFRDFAEEHHLSFRALDRFGPDELDERQKLLFDLSALIWRTPGTSAPQ